MRDIDKKSILWNTLQKLDPVSKKYWSNFFDISEELLENDEMALKVMQDAILELQYYCWDFSKDKKGSPVLPSFLWIESWLMNGKINGYTRYRRTDVWGYKIVKKKVILHKLECLKKFLRIRIRLLKIRFTDPNIIGINN